MTPSVYAILCPRTILAALDFSSLSRAALGTGRDFAALHAAEIELAHLRRDAGLSTGLVPSALDLGAVDAVRYQDAHCRLQRLADGTGAEPIHVAVGSPSRRIAAVSRGTGPDVIGAHGRAWPTRSWAAPPARRFIGHRAASCRYAPPLPGSRRHAATAARPPPDAPDPAAVFRSIHPDYAFPLAELALCELAKAGAGDTLSSGRTEAAIVADAVGVPAALLVPADGGLVAEVSSSGIELTEPIPADGVLRQALQGSSCVDLHPMPTALAAAGVQSGIAVRVGTDAEPLALLVALAPDVRAFDTDARAFLQGAATALHARFVLERTRHSLEESRARARSIFQTTVDGVITIDDHGRIDSFNDGAVRIFGYEPSEVMGRNIAVLMPEPYHAEHDGYLEAYRETGRRRIIGIGREVVGRRKSGATFPMDLAVSEVTLPDGERLFTGLVRDLTDHRVLEREVLRVAEAERRRIGQDLHDGLGQELTAIGLFLRNHARTLDAEGSAAAAEAHRLVGLVDDADTQARTLARSLVPVELEANGLEAALARLAERAAAMYGLEVHAETSGAGAAEASALTADATTNLYHIAQEAISNAAQHGDARRVTVALVRGADHLRLRVEDDGQGIHGTLRRGGVLEPIADGAHAPHGADVVTDHAAGAYARPADQRGMGLRIMHYRAHLAGGSLEIRPGARRGTVVTCTVPLRGPGFYAPNS